MSLDPKDYLARLKKIKTVEELDVLEQELFGRKGGAMTLALKELGGLDAEEKKRRGLELNQTKQTLQLAIGDKRTELTHASIAELAETDGIDATLTLPAHERGHLHLIPSFITEVEEHFANLGFDVAEGPEIESESYNFTMLNFEKDHPALDMQATFWIDEKGDDNRSLLRTHTSPVQIRYMKEHKPPFRMICPGRVYRRDADATHSPMFHQFEGLMVGKDVSLANMKHVMISAMKKLMSPDIEFRFRTSYFPFVEPGLEVDIKWESRTDESTALRQAQGNVHSARWLEVVGCGMVHPHVLQGVGIDPETWQGFAFGFGIERLLMIRHGIKDLRSFYEGDMRFLQQF